jgi:hypothetical protein
VSGGPLGYVDSVRERLGRAGFRDEAPPDGAVLKARRREVKLSRFGVVETVVVISDVAAKADAERLRSFSEQAVRSAKVGKSRLPLGLGSSLVVYPVLLADGISDGLTQFAKDYVPKSWSTVEFPIVVDPSPQIVVFSSKTPVWGAAYYRKTRREAAELLGPETPGHPGVVPP